MDGSAPAISIGAMMTATGFTWAAVMIALNQVDDGCRLLKSRMFLSGHARVSKAAVVADFDADGLPCPCAFVVCQDENPKQRKLRKS